MKRNLLVADKHRAQLKQKEQRNTNKDNADSHDEKKDQATADKEQDDGDMGFGLGFGEAEEQEAQLQSREQMKLVKHKTRQRINSIRWENRPELHSVEIPCFNFRVCFPTVCVCAFLCLCVRFLRMCV